MGRDRSRARRGDRHRALAATFSRPDVQEPGPAAAADPPSAASAVLDEEFELFDEQTVRLADWRGTPLVVNFWASWCPPCVAEMRDAFEPLHQELRDDLVFVGLNLQDTPDAAHEVVEQTGVTYTLGKDPTGGLFTAFGGFGMPTTVFIDADGTIAASHTGAITFDQLRNLIRTHLSV